MTFMTGKKLLHRQAAVQSERERDAREARKLQAWIAKFTRTWGRPPTRREIEFRK